MNTQNDRNFDDIADHFAKKVYGGLKGQIRLAVLERDLGEHLQKHPLKILDVGAGLAQISLNLAKTHDVVISDISSNMIAKAQTSAHEIGVTPTFIVSPYQELSTHLQGQKFDVILCHAVLEWLSNPSQIMAFFDEYLSNEGILSLCFYNPASLIYRNLIMGNFYQLDKPKPADNKSLTPNNPVAYETVEQWLLDKSYTILCKSGIRVFSDYAPLKRGGLTNPNDVIAMELRYSQIHPFWQMGRYLHLLAKKSHQ
ncbi:methyltransferase domain-containing protein [Moraxella oblonga]|uniref:methyltransferase domain-containing protein n=1 Tax=Moraxella oblonga TaxID=200413 RepID=UPI0009FD3398|nr:methyltransferase domain-containing protein [Moraxella oblonga]